MRKLAIAILICMSSLLTFTEVLAHDFTPPCEIHDIDFNGEVLDTNVNEVLLTSKVDRRGLQILSHRINFKPTMKQDEFATGSSTFEVGWQRHF